MGSSENDLLPKDTIGKVITCKAAVAYGCGEPLVLEEILVAPPQKMEVRIKILYTSICHTDLSVWLGEHEAYRIYPRILGHEASGLVESVGEGVDDLEVGDHVVPVFNAECRKCPYCTSEKTNMCKRIEVNPAVATMVNDGKCRFSTKDGQPIYHFLNTSTFTQYTVVDYSCVVKIDANAPLQKMSLLGCGVSTGLGAVWNTANVQPGETIAVFGLGAVGLAAVEGARTRGASRIIGVDINPDKRIKGEAVGITDFVNPKDLDIPVHQKIAEMTAGGVDYSFECAGNLDVLHEAFLSTHEGWGLTVLIGMQTSPRLLPIHPKDFFRGRKMVGSIFGGFKPKSQLPDFARQCINGVVKLDEFITHEMPFSKINDAMQLLVEGKTLRCLLHL
ncbi:alcohol dehydrogenase-like 4 [Andrographis paniculata]|uniref:alcohol dehydrogenase-like 4 n=1 Tax=Andrographis paniculata TaxID=175694 RepID=UPI0021E91215|nr:alcohol dehydrogenase-like 4 [Andrographis paniculata]